MKIHFPLILLIALFSPLEKSTAQAITPAQANDSSLEKHPPTASPAENDEPSEKPDDDSDDHSDDDATPAKPPRPGWNELRLVAPRFSVGFQYNSYDYEEPGLMDIRMPMYGVTGQVLIPLPNPSYLFIGEGSYIAGSGRYDGGYTTVGTSTVTPSSANTHTSILTMRGLIGSQGLIGESNFFLTYIGLAIQGLSNNTDGPGGYRREVNYFYIPVGIEYTLKASSSLQFGAGAEYDYLVVGTVKSYLSDANPSWPDVTNHEYRGDGNRFFFSARLLTSTIGYEVKPYLYNWRIADSDTSMGLYEPHNRTTQTGVDFNILF